MNVFEIRDYLKDAMKEEAVTFHFDRKEETLRIERNDNHKGLTIKLAPVAAKYKEKKEKFLTKYCIILKRRFKHLEMHNLLMANR